MFDRYRQFIRPAGVGLAIAALLVIAALAGQRERQPNGDAVAAHSAQATKPAVEPFGVGRVAVEEVACADAAKVSAEDAEGREKRDLCAQFRAAVGAEKAARWTEIQTWIGVFGLVGVLYGLWLNYRATKAATEANKQARNFFAEERRAWVSVQGAVSRIYVNEEVGSGIVTLRLTAKNIGHSLATDVAFWSSKEPLLFWDGDDVERLAEQIQLDRAAARPPKGAFIFPGEPKNSAATLRFDAVPRDVPGSFFFAWGWVSYTQRESKARHYTPYCFMVVHSFDQKAGKWTAEAYSHAVSIAPD